MRVSDNYPIGVEAKTDEERYIIEEAKKYLDETAVSSVWRENDHVDNVVKLGRKNIDFLMKMMRENNHPQGMYSHFLIDVVFGLYKDDLKIEGYLGVDGCMKALLKLYDEGVLKILDEYPQKVLELDLNSKSCEIAELTETKGNGKICKGLFGKSVKLGK